MKVVYLPRTNLLGIPPLQPGQIDQGVVGTYHAKDVRTGKLPGVLDKLLKPAPAAPSRSGSSLVCGADLREAWG